jgi:hypothetical protein
MTKGVKKIKKQPISRTPPPRLYKTSFSLPISDDEAGQSALLKKVTNVSPTFINVFMIFVNGITTNIVEAAETDPITFKLPYNK